MKKEFSLEERMKQYYENATRIYLPRRTYTIIRIDGKAFHTYTKGLESPFDVGFIEDMDKTACFLCKNIQGAKFAFVQSDEISILLTDFDTLTTSAWFDGNIQKMVSVSASMATAEFNRNRYVRYLVEKENLMEGYLTPTKDAMFDSRVFTIPSYNEVINYFVWRQQDTVRNSIQSVGYSLYSPKEVYGKNTNELQEMCFQKGINWNDYDAKLKRGRLIKKEEYTVKNVLRTRWISVESPIFTKNRDFFKDLIPLND